MEQHIIGYADSQWDLGQAIREKIKQDDAEYYRMRKEEEQREEVMSVQLNSQVWKPSTKYTFPITRFVQKIIIWT